MLRLVLTFCISCTAFTQIQVSVSSASMPGGATRSQDYKFDVESIRQSKPDVSMSVQHTADSYMARGITLRSMICAAYSVKSCSMISGLPTWADTEKYDVSAKIDEKTVSTLAKLSENEQLGAHYVMLQNLLSERFHLKKHTAPKESPVYLLSKLKSDSRLQVSKPSEIPAMMVGADHITAVATSMEDLIESLQGMVDRVVVDQTGLKERYDFTLKLSTGEGQERADSPLSVYTALREQLGLKLTPGKASLESLVVDAVERPTAN